MSDGIELYYEEEGAGFPLVMLHGLMWSGMTFQREIDRLKAHYRVIALDSRGHGKSGKPPVYTWQDHVQDVIALLDTIGIESCYLLGASMGSYIAQGVAIAVPRRIKKLVLIAPKSNGLTSSMQEMLERHAGAMKDLALEDQIGRAFSYMFHNQAAVRKALTDWHTGQVTLNDPQEQAAANKALEGFDFRHDLKNVTAQTLVISGKHDGLNPPERGREVALLIPDSAFVEFQHSGHAPSIEEPERFLEEITNFLASAVESKMSI
ncbi:alpha/beta fold hydrolase [Paenibacillus protaetiae]|uniref:Alpha/beta fold hydrolase n=2 Tax=Paenibacillus protaetiae TaxID=2509456 RepID=A0A4P6F5Q7_9BACL|nr:alpha/beta fold hydrolase [Paenibacillus protaetiae]